MANEKIKVGIIGLGNRGYALANALVSKQPDVDVVAVCDVYEDRVKKGVEAMKRNGHSSCLGFTDYKQMLDLKLDAVFVFTAWRPHIPITLDFMRRGVYVGMEVGGAYSLDDCYELVKTYEETKTPCMMLENCCYGKYELAVLGMVRKGLFGDVVHCAGGYKHDLRREVLTGDVKRHYRLEEYKTRNCEQYPTHEIGPIAKVLDINNGNRFVSLVSYASPSKGLHDFANRFSAVTESLKTTEFKQADIITTLLKCANGETVSIVLDTSLPRSYSRGFTVCGTKARYEEDGNWFFSDEKTPRVFEFLTRGLYNSGKRMVRKNYPEIWKNEKRKGGINLRFHGGMDGITIHAFLEAVRRREDVPIDVYDTATYMAITPLSEMSIQQNATVEFPDFTHGEWEKGKKPLTSPYALDRYFRK